MMPIDISDMDDFLQSSKIDIADMDSFIQNNHYAPKAPSMEGRTEGGGESLYSFGQLNKEVSRTADRMSGEGISKFIADLAKQKGEMTGATAGAVSGLNYASKVPSVNPIIKGLAMTGGAAIGGGLGYMADQKGDTNASQVTKAMGRSAAGEAIGVGTGQLAGRGISKAGEAVSNKIAKNIYGHLDAQKARDILELANSKGIRLLPNQVSDNKAVDQLLGVVGQNPVLSQKINTINKSNKTALLRELNNALNEMGVDSVAMRSADDIDPLGRKVFDYLDEAKRGRTKEIQNAYSEFERYGGAFTTDSKPIKAEVQKLEELAQSMPNPGGYRNAVQYVLKALDKPELTSVDLNNVIKQINYNMKHLGSEDYAIESGYKKMKGILDSHLDTLAKQDGSYNKLAHAKKLYSSKRTIYDRPEIKKILKGGADPETIYDLMLTGKNSITNAKVLKDELLRTKQGEKILGTLARRQIDEALYKVRLNQNVFQDGELDTSAFLKVLNEVDYRQLEILGGKEIVESIDEMRKLTKIIQKQDKVLSGEGGGLNTMGIIRSNVLDAMASILRIKTFGEILTSPATHSRMLKMLRTATKETRPNNVPQVVEGINKDKQEIIDALR